MTPMTSRNWNEFLHIEYVSVESVRHRTVKLSSIWTSRGRRRKIL